MNEKLTNEEKELLGNARLILRFLNTNMNLAMFSQEKVTETYRRLGELYQKSGDMKSANECMVLFHSYQNPYFYISCIEDGLKADGVLRGLTKAELVIIFYNLLEACIVNQEDVKAKEYKRRLDELLMEE